MFNAHWRPVRAVTTSDPFEDDEAASEHVPAQQPQQPAAARNDEPVQEAEDAQPTPRNPLLDLDLPPPPAPLDAIIPAAVHSAAAQREGENKEQSTPAQVTPAHKDPQTLEEALQSAQGKDWKDAYDTELQNLLSFGTFVLVKRKSIPSNAKVLGHKVVCRTKFDDQGKETKKKCRIVAKGFMENTEGQLTFAPVSSYSSIRLVLSLAAALDLDLHQADIKSAYLRSYLPEDRDTYMTVPPGLAKKDEHGNELVCKLVRGIYGLASSGRLWSDKLCAFMTKQGFKRAHGDPALYYRGSGKDLFLVTTHVDDLLLAGSSDNIKGFLDALKASDIEASSQGELRFLLNMQVERDRSKKTITLHQTTYVRNLLTNFSMQNAHPVSTPMEPHTTLGSVSVDKKTGNKNARPERYSELVGSLLYLSNTVRPDIAAAVGQLSRFLSDPKEHHWHAAVRVLRYLKGTMDLGISYNGCAERQNVLYGYADSDWGGCKDTKRSTSGYVFMLNGGAISWSSKRQSVVALSTAEAELVSATAATQEAVHLQILLAEIGFKQDTTTIFEDNQPCIKIAENPITSPRTKHIDIRYFYVRDKVLDKTVKLVGVSTVNMVADCLTKELDRAATERFRTCMLGERHRVRKSNARG